MADSRAFLVLLFSTLLAGMLALALPGCGGGSSGPRASPGRQDSLTFERLSRRVRWQPPPLGKGETEVVVQFSVRDQSGRAYGMDEVTVEMRLDDQPLDPEAILERNSKLLEADIRYALVLDASASMLIPDKEPFLKMRAAAADSVTTLEKAWADNSGAVDWTFLWFSDVINKPYGGPLEPAHILKIPEPQPGDFTKLYAAVYEMATQMKNEYDRELFAAGELDSHVIVIFSDGQDNHSHQNNTALPPTRGELGNGVYYQTFGYRPVDLTEVTRAIEAHPGLVVHAIGLGEKINEAELQKLVTAERGGKLMKGDTVDIPSLFEAVTREFTTLQTHGARVPLKPGDYTFRVEVVSRSNPQDRGSFTFQFHTGDAGAGVRPRAPAFLTRAPETVTVGDWYRHAVEVDAYPTAGLTVAGTPAWLRLDRVNGRLIGLPDTADLGHTGTITLEAQNGEPPGAIQRFSVDVFLPWTGDASGVLNDLNGLWGAAGVGFFAAGNAGTIIRLDPIRQTWAPMVPVPTGNDLSAIHGVYRDQNQTRTLEALYAVGSGDILRYRTSRGWEKLFTGFPQRLHGVWAPVDDDVHIVGEGGTILHFDGTRWAFIPSGTTGTLRRIWGAAANDVFATGDDGMILHYDDVTWRPMVSGSVEDLHGIWGPSGESVFAVGRRGTILRYEENRWRPMNAGTERDLWDVWGTAPDDVFAVGEGGTLLHFNGAVWKQMESGTTRDLLAVWGADSKTVFVAGSGGLILRYGRR